MRIKQERNVSALVREVERLKQLNSQQLKQSPRAELLETTLGDVLTECKVPFMLLEHMGQQEI